MQFLLFLLVACGGSPKASAPNRPPDQPADPQPAASPASGSDTTSVQETIERYSGQVRYCYESRLNDAPGLEGRVELQWSLEAGVASSPRLVEDTTGDEDLVTCIQRKILRWRFPPEASGSVTWPFVFRSK